MLYYSVLSGSDILSRRAIYGIGQDKLKRILPWCSYAQGWLPPLLIWHLSVWFLIASSHQLVAIKSLWTGCQLNSDKKESPLPWWTFVFIQRAIVLRTLIDVDRYQGHVKQQTLGRWSGLRSLCRMWTWPNISNYLNKTLVGVMLWHPTINWVGAGPWK